MSGAVPGAAWRAMIEARVERLERVLDVERDLAAEDRAMARAREPHPPPSSAERRDSILARIAEILPRPDGGSTRP